MEFYENPELLGLYRTYTAGQGTVAAHFNATAATASIAFPLVIGTATDLALFPGQGAPPVVERLRTTTRGFKELAGVSHLGPAVATVMAMKRFAPDGSWRADAMSLIDSCRTARAANSIALWRDKIAVEAYAGREEAITRMVDYTCRVTENYLARALADPFYLTSETLRTDYLDGLSDDLPVSMNRIMVATFFLTGLDMGYRVISFFDRLKLDWEHAMVMMVGRFGKPTGAVTRGTHSLAVIVDAASRGRLPTGNLLIAPHAPVFPSYDGTNLDAVAASEQGYREFWSQTMAMAELARDMFEGYPAFAPRRGTNIPITPDTTTIEEMPEIKSADDWLALTTRLRMVLEDPRQQLAAAVSDFAARQLVEHDNDPTAVTVPGLDGEPYPELSAIAAGRL
jgi:hypothetical protein